MPLSAFRLADLSDVPRLQVLVNAAYQPTPGKGGWTDETCFVVGTRVSAVGLGKLLRQADSIVLLGLEGNNIIACVHIEKSCDLVHLGMLAVDPVHQGAGVGKQMLAEAETFARSHFKVTQLVLIVIELRTELIAFYERRGYHLTTNKIDYGKVCGDTCAAKIPGLQLTVMEKNLDWCGQSAPKK